MAVRTLRLGAMMRLLFPEPSTVYSYPNHPSEITSMGRSPPLSGVLLTKFHTTQLQTVASPTKVQVLPQASHIYPSSSVPQILNFVASAFCHIIHGIRRLSETKTLIALIRSPSNIDHPTPEFRHTLFQQSSPNHSTLPSLLQSSDVASWHLLFFLSFLAIISSPWSGKPFPQKPLFVCCSSW